MYDLKSVGQNIRQARESKFYSQEYLAAKLKISQNAYSKTELGYTSITLDRLLQIADVLEVDALDLLKTMDKKLSA
jgi:transcriptional regulator with XRE-family HTH domain